MKKKRCRACKTTQVVLVEYSWDHTEHHDGWSEVWCQNEKCGVRTGRWSGKILKKGESERRELMYKI